MTKKREELYFNNEEELEHHFPADQLNIWVSKGKPKLWLKTHDFYCNEDSIITWSDHAYGGIRLIVNGDIQMSMDIVQSGEYVAMSAAYSTGMDDFQDVKVLKTIAVK